MAIMPMNSTGIPCLLGEPSCVRAPITRGSPTTSRYSCSNRARSSVPRFHSSQNCRSASSNSASRPFATAFFRGVIVRAVATLEVLAVVAEGARRRVISSIPSLAACSSRRGRRTARARAPRRPTAAATARPAAAAARTGPMARNSAPIMPSGVQLSSPIVPPGRHTPHQLVGDLLVVRREHRADRRHDDVERLVVERQVLGVGRRPIRARGPAPPPAAARPRAAPASGRWP